MSGLCRPRPLSAELDAADRGVANRLPDNTTVRIDTSNGADRPVLTALDRLDDPPSLLALRAAVDALRPRVDLPEVLPEVADWTGFLTEFTHVSDGTPRAPDLGVSLCAVFVAEATNTGLEPVVRPDTPVLTRGRLSWTDQNYVRGETITAANTRFVDAQSKIPLAAWGGGDVASADGLRFVGRLAIISWLSRRFGESQSSENPGGARANRPHNPIRMET